MPGRSRYELLRLPGIRTIWRGNGLSIASARTPSHSSSGSFRRRNTALIQSTARFTSSRTKARIPENCDTVGIQNMISIVILRRPAVRESRRSASNEITSRRATDNEGHERTAVVCLAPYTNIAGRFVQFNDRRAPAMRACSRCHRRGASACDSRAAETPHRVRLVLDHLEQDQRRALGAAAALLPALDCGEAKAEARGRDAMYLRHAEPAPERPDIELGRDGND